MKTFLIEREIPGASELSDEDLRGITSTSNDAVESLSLIHISEPTRPY